MTEDRLNEMRNLRSKVESLQEQIDNFQSTGDFIQDVYALNELNGELDIYSDLDMYWPGEDYLLPLKKKYWQYLEDLDNSYFGEPQLFWWDDERKMYIVREVMKADENEIMLAPDLLHGSQMINHPDEVMIDEESLIQLRDIAYGDVWND